MRLISATDNVFLNYSYEKIETRKINFYEYQESFLTKTVQHENQSFAFSPPNGGAINFLHIRRSVSGQLKKTQRCSST